MINLLPNNTWDSTSQLRPIPLGDVLSVQFNFKDTRDISSSSVYVECVVDDHGDSTKGNIGQYNVGDRFICDQLQIINNGASVKVVNPLGEYLTAPKGNGGNSGNKVPQTFTIDSTNYDKYKLRCFASHTHNPSFSELPSYFDKIITVKAADVKGNAIVVPHTLGGLPWVVEINFVAIKGNKIGLPEGLTVPLKYINGMQFKVGSADGGIFTTSADKTNVYLGTSTGNIAAIMPDKAMTALNLWSNASFDIQVCVKKDYPNPFGDTFTQKELDPNWNVNDSEVIPNHPRSGDIMDYDMVLMNNKASDTAYAPGEFIFLNQSGGNSAGAFHEISQFISLDPIARKIHFRMNLPKPAIWLMVDRKTGKTFDLAADMAAGKSEWTSVFRWQYENTTDSCNVDTGWINAKVFLFSQDTMVLTGGCVSMSDGTEPSKVDVYARFTTPSPTLDMVQNGAINITSLKGGGQGYTVSKTNKVWNNSAIAYDKTSLTISHMKGNCMTIPYFKGTSGVTFDNMAGGLEFRICAKS